MPSEDSETRSPPRTLLPSSAFGSPVHTPSAGSVSSSATITPENPKPRRAKGLDLNRPPHVPTMDPAQRQNAETKWRHGVLNAGRVIDMLETLSRTKYEYDQEVVQWLTEQYVKPYGKFDRVDGLVVRSKEHL
jgi:hypothetical protein